MDKAAKEFRLLADFIDTEMDDIYKSLKGDDLQGAFDTVLSIKRSIDELSLKLMDTLVDPFRPTPDTRESVIYTDLLMGAMLKLNGNVPSDTDTWTAIQDAASKWTWRAEEYNAYLASFTEGQRQALINHVKRCAMRS